MKLTKAKLKIKLANVLKIKNKFMNKLHLFTVLRGTRLHSGQQGGSVQQQRRATNSSNKIVRVFEVDSYLADTQLLAECFCRDSPRSRKTNRHWHGQTAKFSFHMNIVP